MYRFSHAVALCFCLRVILTINLRCFSVCVGLIWSWKKNEGHKLNDSEPWTIYHRFIHSGVIAVHNINNIFVTYDLIMVTSSNGNIFRVTAPLWGVDSLHKSQWRGALVLSLICAWTNSFTNRDAGDLSHQCAHYDVNVMLYVFERNMCRKTNYKYMDESRWFCW